MKIRYLWGLFFTAFWLCSSQAVANVITDVEAVDAYVGHWKGISWTHDLSDQPFTLGSALSGTLTIEFSDDNKRFLPDLPEFASIVVGVFDFQDEELIYKATRDWSGDLGINSLAILNGSGMLDVRVWSDFGDFHIGNSILEVVTSSSIPEPVALCLLGIGLIVLGLVRTRRAASPLSIAKIAS